MHTNIHFLASPKPAAQRAVRQFVDRYGQYDIATASHVVAIGGDGTTLRALHAVRPAMGKAVFAMRLPASVGAWKRLLICPSYDRTAGCAP